MEKPKIAKKQESPDAPESETLMPTANETEILDLLHKEAELHHNGHTKHDSLDQLHQDIARCECYPFFKQYVSGEIPTLDRLFNNLKPFITELDTEISAARARANGNLEDEEVKGLERRRSLLLGRETQIRGSVQRYVNSVIRFNTLKKASAGGTRDLTKQFEQADHARRRAHNDLLGSLTTYAKLVGEMVEEGDNQLKTFPFEIWRHGQDARTIAPDKTVVFSAKVMENRDFVRDWAIVADFHNQLRILGDKDWLKENGDHSIDE